MKKQHQQRDHKAVPPVSGTMKCQKGHQWSVRDLNPERRVVNCPVCGGYTSISQGLENEQRK